MDKCPISFLAVKATSFDWPPARSNYVTTLKFVNRNATYKSCRHVGTGGKKAGGRVDKKKRKIKLTTSKDIKTGQFVAQ